MVKLSFIVPVYNVEQYLRKCLGSLMAQDYNNYEIILVDDGSTDNSAAICDEYASASFTSFHQSIIPIMVIHQKNGGLSVARNTGIAAAKGEYICFVDSDDYWEPNVLSGLMAQIERDKLDVLRFKYQHVNENYEVFNLYKRDFQLDNDYSEIPTDGVSFLNSRMNTQCYAVMFILRRDMIIGAPSSLHSFTPSSVNTLFTPGIYFEDTDWTPRMLSKANRVASTDTIVYNYLVREGSISRAIDCSKRQKVLDDKIRLIATLQQQAVVLKKSGRYNGWYSDMIADTVVSVIGILSGLFYEDREKYLESLHQLNIYPIKPRSFKARLINLSPKFAVKLLHFKNN